MVRSGNASGKVAGDPRQSSHTQRERQGLPVRELDDEFLSRQSLCSHRELTQRP